MQPKLLFSTVGIICMLFGISLTFTPDLMGDQYLTNPQWINAGARFVAQGWGTTLFAVGMACWYARNAGPSLGRKAMILFILVSNLALVVISSIAVLNGVETALGWAQALLAAGLAAWSGMLFRQETSVS
ncbi:hypothetical protein [Larkinella soli]|uniref:hypothetical protein n=1 Tax=Larkinella soli TaxID=1770527 RepID=UPI000FFC40BD|nr:hypothetical protein [Larkinella soli]